MADEHVGTSSATGESSDSIVDLHIKTLESQLYNFSVDKNMLVSAFKEKISGEVGLPVAQQRLIFRGKVLKDEHPLSEYHVENGVTLHLVARQPSESQPSSGASTGTTTANGTNTGQDANAAGRRPRVSHISHSVLLGSFGPGGPGDQNNGGGPADISRIIGAVLDSIGVGGPNSMGGMGGIPPNMPSNIPTQATQGNEAGANANNQGQPGNPNQSAPQGTQNPFGGGIPIPTFAAPIPDSLHTLTEFMNRMEQALSENGYQPNRPSNDAEHPNDAERPPAAELPPSARGIPFPADLAVVMRHAQWLLSGPAIDSLSHTAGRLEEEATCNDPTVRAQIQSEAMQSGLAMQHLGALLLELGRTMLTLRVGQAPAVASVYAGPAVYISPSGPNPIMVQPFALQTNSLFGRNATSPNSASFGPVGIAAVPRQLNVHIHAGLNSRGTTAGTNQANGTPNVPAAAGGVNSQAGGVNLQAGANVQTSEVSSQTREVDDSTRTENQASAGQPEGSVSKSEGQTETVEAENTTSCSSATKPANEVEGTSSSSTVADNSATASSVPLGLGLGGLQQKKRSQPKKPETTNSSVPPVNAPTSVSTSNPADGQLDPAAMMNEVIASPALDDLLSGVSSQTGIGSPDVLRNMLGQLTQNPAMMNTVNQIAQQLDGNEGLSNMFSSMGGGSRGGSGGGGGFDLSSMMQQMMPMVAQAFGGGGSGPNMFQQPPSMNREPQPTGANDLSSDPEVNIQDLVEKIENEESPEEVFSSVVEAAAYLNDDASNADELSEMCFEEDLTHEFMEMLKRDISRRAEEEGE